MAFDPATLLSRTAAGDAELSTPRNGLSLSQRKLLTFLDQPQALEELAAERALEATKLERDLAKLASLNLIAINGAGGAPPAAASIVIGGARTQSLLRWISPPLLLVGAGLAYFAMSAPSPRKTDAPTTRLSVAPVAGAIAGTPAAATRATSFPTSSAASTATLLAASSAASSAASPATPPTTSVVAAAANAATPAVAGTGRDSGAPTHSASARTLPESLQAENGTTQALPADTFKSTAAQPTARAAVAGEPSNADANPHAGANALADAVNVRASTETGRAVAGTESSPHPPASVAPRGEIALSNSAPPAANTAVASAAVTTGAVAVANAPATIGAVALAKAPAETPATTAAGPANPVATAATTNTVSPPPNPTSAPQPSAATAPVKLAMAAPSAAVAHVPAAVKLLPLTREDPEFPREAFVRGVTTGIVKARLAIDAAGKVTAVSIVDARPSRVFDRAVTQALSHWLFPAGEAGRSTEVEVAFRRD